MARLKVKDVADEMGLPVQAVRVRLQKGMLPFGDAVMNKGSSVYHYYINAERYELWKRGELKQ